MTRLTLATLNAKYDGTGYTLERNDVKGKIVVRFEDHFVECWHYRRKLSDVAESMVNMEWLNGQSCDLEASNDTHNIEPVTYAIPVPVIENLTDPVSGTTISYVDGVPTYVGKGEGDQRTLALYDDESDNLSCELMPPAPVIESLVDRETGIVISWVNGIATYITDGVVFAKYTGTNEMLSCDIIALYALAAEKAGYSLDEVYVDAGGRVLTLEGDIELEPAGWCCGIIEANQDEAPWSGFNQDETGCYPTQEYAGYDCWATE